MISSHGPGKKVTVATVSYRNASRLYPGSDHPAVNNLSLDIGDGEFMVLVGPSGCGKTTSLRMLAGLEEVSSGSIWIGGREVTTMAPKDRDIAMVFQNYALYPHMTVAENMAFALRMQHVARNERQLRVNQAAELLGLRDLLGRKPANLSGGQRQRVAMGRAIVRSPQVFLMDEPLSNLDANLRVQTRTQISELQSRLGVTTVYVTHDQVEAMTMGDRVAVMKDGLLQQVDSPLRLYAAPTNIFVAGFIGSPAMNLLTGQITGGGVQIDQCFFPIDREVLAKASSNQVVVGIRPEQIRLASQETGLLVTVFMVEQTGADSYLYGTLGEPGRAGEFKERQLIARLNGQAPPSRGEQVFVNADPAQLHIFDAQSGARLN